MIGPFCYDLYMRSSLIDGVQLVLFALCRTILAGKEFPQLPADCMGKNYEFSTSDAIDCEKESHPEAMHWVTCFHRVDYDGRTQSISVQFLAAPENYCFSSYEVFLTAVNKGIIDEQIISKSQVVKANLGGRAVQIVSYRYDNLSINSNYQLLVVPTARDEQKRCACPVRKEDMTRLYDMGIACSCQVSLLNINYRSPPLSSASSSAVSHRILATSTALLLATSLALHHLPFNFHST
uniref:ILCR1 Ig-like domain-containing protein n=1 Tax=Plectus sambesii TaxID=2011161 RepID=A0A914WTR8_9BILA